MSAASTIIFQSAKLGDIPRILDELDWAQSLLENNTPFDRIYGLSGGALTAWAFALAASAALDPTRWGKASSCITDLAAFLKKVHRYNLRAYNPNPSYGPFNLKPLRRKVASMMRAFGATEMMRISEMPVTLYLCAIDQDGTFILFGKPDASLQFQYQFVHVVPPQDASVLDALTAALSTLLSTTPVQVNGAWYRDCRPAVVDAGAIVNDLEAADPRFIIRSSPYTPLRRWKINFITSSFIMHAANERNQALLAVYYLDLVGRHRELQTAVNGLPAANLQTDTPSVHHIQLPYVGSTEAFTNMRQSVEQKSELMEKFKQLLVGQVENIPYHQPANIIYGAGGFSGILGGLVTTRAMNAGFAHGGGQIQQVYGVSAGVLNGFFHAVQLAASRHPEIYRPAAQNALNDLEDFIATIKREKFANYNLNPKNFWLGFANLKPLERYLIKKLGEYTGAEKPEILTFDDIQLPLTVTAARRDGFTEFFGMSKPARRMTFANREWTIQSVPVISAVIAGWSMNTYVQPAMINNQVYCDGGGAFYDIGLFAAMLDEQLTNLINIHLDEPEGHTYHIPARPNLVRILFDTHNYYFPEERRRMWMLINLLYKHYHMRHKYTARLSQLPQGSSAPGLLPNDFRQSWLVD